ncbi:MAG: 3'(2'),5'-bisphosphate nucleotidase CysQ [Deltaproteobacteria bacterium]|nr:3'(2'),5'-bisphosphate nucleotidase CysQ [Deltaproteobacteria bacterium]MBW2311775.1 3'(2'),5'-bisphosphate nucleotidase CysQ [Deltaproteobacteria bacterium]
MNEELDHLLETARQAARSAAERIRDIYQQYLSGGSIDIRDKGVDDPVTAADMSANQIITRAVKEAFPHHAILTEEEPHTWSETGHEWVWMIDPLDGTRDFIKANGEFVTMVGATHHAEPTIGVVIEPATGLELCAVKSGGAYKSSLSKVEKPTKITAPPSPDLKGLRIAISRSHRDSKVDELIRLLGVQAEISSGSVGRKMALVIHGQADLYVHPSRGTKLWDTCACEVIASEAGLVLLSGTGEPIQYHRPSGDVENRYGLLMCSPAIVDKVVWATRKVWGLDCRPEENIY